jgi:phosphoribosyl 1,2-cyclic phosphodiesterase
MELSVLASGSNGNCCLVEDSKISVLIDAGKSCKEIEARSQKLGKSLENLNALLLTHGHQDHISGVGILARKYNIPVYLSHETFAEFGYKLGNCTTKLFDVDKSFRIDNLEIRPIRTSHNVSSCGFALKNFGLFTDTGIITQQMAEIMPKLKCVLLESNHDIDMLVNGTYPAFLKQWILSDKGHLSNIDASSLIQSKGENLGLALLGHLSENNNTVEMAKKTFETIVKKKIEYEVCSRHEETGCWQI